MRELASQINEVATLVLNGGGMTDVQMDQIRVYSALVRTEVQAMNLHALRSRILKEEPDLSLEPEDE